MPREVITHVPDDMWDIYQAEVAPILARYGIRQVLARQIPSRPLTREEKLAQFNAEFTARIDRLKQPTRLHPSHPIADGYRKLLEDSFLLESNRDATFLFIPTKPREMDLCRQALLAIFLGCTRRRPETFKDDLWQARWRNVISPTQVEILIRFYGLEDGEQQGTSAIERAYPPKPNQSTVENQIKRARQLIRHRDNSVHLHQFFQIDKPPRVTTHIHRAHAQRGPFL